MKNLVVRFTAQIALIAGLGLASGFVLPDFKDIGWDSALFLTPIGMLRNFRSESAAMRSFYLDESRNKPPETLWRQSLMLAALAGLTWNGLGIARSIKSK